MDKKIIVIGLDGAEWHIINKLIDDGRLPTFRKLKNRGTFGNLKSTLPTSSPPAWTSFITGKNPGKHGIFDFVKFDKSKNIMRVSNSNDRKSNCIWNYLGDKKSIVINVPMTFPPDEINGIMISGMPNPEKNPDYCYPKDLYFELKKRFKNDIEIQPEIHYPEGKGKSFVDDQYRCWRNNEKIFWYLKNNKEWDLLICVFHVLDELSHELWRFIDEEHPNHEADNIGEHIYKMYEKADKFLSSLLKDIDENTNLFIVSDHGFGPVYNTVYLNNWLIKKGWLKLKKSFTTKIKSTLHSQGLNVYNILKIANKIGINPLNKAYKGTFRAKSKSLLEFFYEKLFLSFKNVDWENSVAFSMGEFGQIYIKKDNVNDYKSFLKKLKQEIKKIKHPITQKKIFNRVYSKWELYKGDCVEEAPDIIFFDEPMHYLPVKMFEFGSDKLLTPQVFGRSGGHKINGIFFAYGKDIENKSDLKLNIVDIVPTIIYLLGGKIPFSVDGEVKKNIISDRFLEKNRINFKEEEDYPSEKKVLTESDEEIIRERLKELGYL